MQGKAIALSGGVYDTKSAKTTHGLVRGSDRFELVAVVDPTFYGKDAGELLDGIHRGIPMFPSMEAVLAAGIEAPYCVIGLAPKGGRLPVHMREDVRVALSRGISVVSGLHQFLTEDPEFVEIASTSLASIHDIRKPRHRSELHFWVGKVREVTCPTIAVLGTDCGLGKRTTAKIIVDTLRRSNFRAEMIYTGQTGWMQGWKYGFILDATYNDFVSGELEYMIHRCWEVEQPEFILLEGQSSLRNPSGPCGAEFLVSGHVDGVVLQHAPARPYFDGFETLKLEIPPIQSEIELIQMYGVPVIAITLNTKGLTLEQAKTWQKEYEQNLKIPVFLPLEEGLEAVIPLLRSIQR